MQAKYPILVLVALLCIVPAMAVSESFTITAGGDNYNVTVYGAAPSGTYYNVTYPVHVSVNYDNVIIPEQMVLFTDGAYSGSPPPAANGVFTLKRGDTTMGAGTIQISNGTFSGGYNTQVVMQLSYWKYDHGLSGVNDVNMTIDGYTTCESSTVCKSLQAIKQRAYTTTTTYITLLEPLYTAQHAVPGAYYYLGSSACSTDVTLTAFGDASATTMITSEITKSDCPSITKIFTNNTLKYTGASGTSEEYVTTFGGNIIVQSYFVPLSLAYNSSEYFTFSPGAVPTTAPTPTPAGTSMITQYFECIDGASNGRIYDCDVDVLDVTSGTWTNATAAYGSTSFAILNTHTMDAYGSATGFSTATRTGLSPFDGFYQLILQPDWAYCSTPGKCGGASDPGDSNINLIIMVDDYATDDPISGASISLVEPSGATTTGTTNDAGVGLFAFSNKTQVNVKVSKSGYSSASKMWTTSAFGPDTVHIQLNKLVVTQTPTVTYTNAQGTVVPTLDTRSTAQKDASMMDQVRDAGPGLISLAILATMFGLIRMMAK